MTVLDRFSGITRSWFNSTFEVPTPAQDRGWDAIGQGQHTLILAPTGSGKDAGRLPLDARPLATTETPSDERQRCRVLYVSPLKALRPSGAPHLSLSMERLERLHGGRACPRCRSTIRTDLLG